MNCSPIYTSYSICRFLKDVDPPTLAERLMKAEGNQERDIDDNDILHGETQLEEVSTGDVKEPSDVDVAGVGKGFLS
jgi:hypothetical protein